MRWKAEQVRKLFLRQSAGKRENERYAVFDSLYVFLINDIYPMKSSWPPKWANKYKNRPKHRFDFHAGLSKTRMAGLLLTHKSRHSQTVTSHNG